MTHRFTTDGMGRVVGVTRRRASDVDAPVASELTPGVLKNIFHRITDTPPTCECGCGRTMAVATFGHGTRKYATPECVKVMYRRYKNRWLKINPEKYNARRTQLRRQKREQADLLKESAG